MDDCERFPPIDNNNRISKRLSKSASPSRQNRDHPTRSALYMLYCNHENVKLTLQQSVTLFCC